MPERHPNSPLARLIRAVTWFENALLVLMLATMVLLAGAQIIARNFFGASIFGADDLLRLLVLWVAFLGAVTASRNGKHIHVDIIAHWLPGRVQPAVEAITDVFTITVCAVLTWQALRYVASMQASNEMAFGALPVWVASLILPLAFALIALRYSVRLLRHARQALGYEEIKK
jgi:TRAP-type C4-dicarboxylate transport system permease small subunit